MEGREPRLWAALGSLLGLAGVFADRLAHTLTTSPASGAVARPGPLQSRPDPLHRLFGLRV
jgi:hypothetical protein